MLNSWCDCDRSPSDRAGAGDLRLRRRLGRQRPRRRLGRQRPNLPTGDIASSGSGARPVSACGYAYVHPTCDGQRLARERPDLRVNGRTAGAARLQVDPGLGQGSSNRKAPVAAPNRWRQGVPPRYSPPHRRPQTTSPLLAPPIVRGIRSGRSFFFSVFANTARPAFPGISLMSAPRSAIAMTGSARTPTDRRGSLPQSG